MFAVDPAACTQVPDAAQTDPGIAGTGVLLTFIISGAVSLTLSSTILFSTWRGKLSVIRRRLLNSYSDQSLALGIGIQAVGLVKAASLTPYHFFIIWMLSLLSMATHNATLLALVADFRRDWVLRWLRQTLMFVNLVLTCVYGVYVLRAVQRGLEDEPIPIACAWVDEARGARDGGSGNIAISVVGTIGVIAGNCICFIFATWFLHTRSRQWHKLAQIIGLFIMIAIAGSAAVRVMLVSQAFGTPSVPLKDDGEKQWSFGQLLGMLMLLLPLISVVEIMRGDVKVPDPVLEDSASESLPMSSTGHKPIRDSFQPNPLFGSRSSFVRK